MRTGDSRETGSCQPCTDERKHSFNSVRWLRGQIYLEVWVEALYVAFVGDFVFLILEERELSVVKMRPWHEAINPRLGEEGLPPTGIPHHSASELEPHLLAIFSPLGTLWSIKFISRLKFAPGGTTSPFHLVRGKTEKECGNDQVGAS